MFFLPQKSPFDFLTLFLFDVYNIRLKNSQGATMPNKIIIKGAREHNLKNINIEIPRDKLVVITGVLNHR